MSSYRKSAFRPESLVDIAEQVQSNPDHVGHEEHDGNGERNVGQRSFIGGLLTLI